MTKEEMLSAIYNEIGILQEIYSPSGTMYHRIPVRIGDVLDWYNDYNPEHLWCGNGNINGEVICREWDNLRLTIDEQPEDCITFVYSLIKK